MRYFFTSKTFIAICVIAVLLLGMMVVSTADRGKVTIFEDFVGVFITPVQNICTTAIENSGNFLKAFTNYKELKKENEQLKAELSSAEDLIRDAEQARLENEALKSILDIKSKNTDFSFCSALVVATDQSGYSYTATLNKGSVSGIKKRDIVITADGVVGYVTEVGTTWCKITTILDSSCEIGAIITRTQDIGVLEGDFSLASNERCKLSYLANTVQLNSGDSVVTSGIGGIFPAGILIGNVEEIKPESHGISQYAIIEPAVDISQIKNVFVVTGFSPEKTEEAE